jgi:hypothetical protein
LPLHKLLPLDIRGACFAISKNVLVDVPTTEDVVATWEDLCDPVHYGQLSVRAEDFWSHDLGKLL